MSDKSISSVSDINSLAEYCESLEDENAFNSFFSEHLFPKIEKWFNGRYCTNASLKEDVNQESFQCVLKALKNKGYSKAKGDFVHWCMQIYTHCKSRLLSKHSRAPVSVEEPEQWDRGTPNTPPADQWALEDIRDGSFTTTLRDEMDTYSQWYIDQRPSKRSSHYPSEVWLSLRDIELIIKTHLQEYIDEKMVKWHSDEKEWRFQPDWPTIEEIWERMQLPDYSPGNRGLDDLIWQMLKPDSANWYNQRDKHRTRARESVRRCVRDNREMELFRFCFDDRTEYHHHCMNENNQD